MYGNSAEVFVLNNKYIIRCSVEVKIDALAAIFQNETN